MTLTTILIGIITFLAMEFVAWFSHKFIMHGLLWHLHKDHHVQPKSFFQKNDAFFLIFAIPSWLSIMFGMIYQLDFLASIGFGIAAYGLTYFLVHDVYIHERFFRTKHLKIPILTSMKSAHTLHHSNIHQKDGAYFGLLFSPFKMLFKK